MLYEVITDREGAGGAATQAGGELHAAGAFPGCGLVPQMLQDLRFFPHPREVVPQDMPDRDRDEAAGGDLPVGPDVEGELSADRPGDQFPVSYNFV